MSTPLGDVTSGDAMSLHPDLKGWGKRLEMAAEMCELMQKRVDF
jgi:hypothetical protein